MSSRETKTRAIVILLQEDGVGSATKSFRRKLRLAGVIWVPNVFVAGNEIMNHLAGKQADAEYKQYQHRF